MCLEWLCAAVPGAGKAGLCVFIEFHLNCVAVVN